MRSYQITFLPNSTCKYRDPSFPEVSVDIILRFIANGLGQLMDQAILMNSSRIQVMNENGCGRMQLNILVLQQNLRNIEPKALLARSAAFFDLFSTGPDAI